MANPHGDFIWYELMTSDVEAAVAFYGGVLGWASQAFDPSGVGYRVFRAADAHVGGMMPLPAEAAQAGGRPGWLGYIGVDDVDAAAADIVAAGGARHVPPTDIPGVGRFALLADPQGAVFYVMRGAMEQESTAFAPTKTGHCHWNELATSDQPAALAFYGKLFGWEKGDSMPMGEMGEMGDYQLITQHGQAVGGVMPRMEGGPPPMWTFYFGVEDIDIAKETATRLGATVHHGPTEVPGGAFIIVASDPQGAVFGLVGPRNA